MQKELTPTEIASMSEAVAEYMGWEKLERDGDPYYLKSNKDLFWYKCSDAIVWDWIHEVWKKIREDEIFKKYISDDKIVSLISYGTPLEAFTALYNAIEFINN